MATEKKNVGRPSDYLQGHKGTGHYHREGGMVFLSALLLQSA